MSDNGTFESYYRPPTFQRILDFLGERQSPILLSVAVGEHGLTHRALASVNFETLRHWPHIAVCWSHVGLLGLCISPRPLQIAV